MFSFFFKIFFIFYFATAFAHNQPISIEADKLSYNEQNNIITAEGDVLIKKEKCQLVTDKIIFDQRKQYLYLVGDFIIKSDRQKYYFGKKAFFSTGTTKGTIVKFQARLFEKKFFISDFVKVQKNNSIVIKNFIFSTCKICPDSFVTYSSLWQIRLDKAAINYQKNKVIFKENMVELMGIPVFYLPYITIPNINVTRTIGLFIPRLKKSNPLELQISIPYYFSISPHINFSYIHLMSNKKKDIFNVNIEYLTRYGLCRLHTYLLKKKNSFNSHNYEEYLHTNATLKTSGDYFINYKIQRLFDRGKITDNNKITHNIILDDHFSLMDKKKDTLITIKNFSFRSLDIKKKIS